MVLEIKLQRMKLVKEVYRRFKWDMNPKSILACSLGLNLLNKYLELIISCLEPKIFDEKVEALFCKIQKKTNKYSTVPLNILALQFNFQEHYSRVYGKSNFFKISLTFCPWYNCHSLFLSFINRIILIYILIH